MPLLEAQPRYQADLREQGVVARQELGPARSSLNRLESLAERELEEVTRLLDHLTYVHLKNDADKIAKEVIRGARTALKFFDNFAQLHPIASGVVKALSVVIDLECQRHENDAHIAVVHTSMVKTVFHLRYLNHVKDSFEEESLKGAMTVLCKDMAKTIKKFGEFVDTYHIHWQKTVKFLFSYAHKKALEHFSEEFEKLRREMDDMYKSTMQIQMATVLSNTTEILNRIRFVDPETLQAQRFVEAKGGPNAVLQDPLLIDQVAVHLKEKVTHTMRSVLQVGFDDLLSRHAPRFHIKYQSVEAHIVQSERRVVEISEGPHKIIEDAELQQLWITNGWRATVKCRCFVEGLHEYYYGQLHAEKPGASITSEDAWTLEYFSRAMYYAAIGDIIDDDGSGYISALELNAFLKSEQRCLPKWTKPQWFAFWASGWHNNNAWYHDEIDHVMQSVQDTIQNADLDSRNPHWESATLALQSLKSLLLVVDNEEFSSVDESRVPYQLMRLQQEFREYEEKTISEKLHHFGFYLVDRASIVAVVGDTRIELHMMPLLHILAKRIRDLVSKIVQQQHLSSQDVCEIEALVTSCIAVFVAFDSRLRELSRGWRLEAKDIGMQVDRYADGLFKKYFTKPWLFHKAYDDLRCSMFGDEHELPRHLRPVMRTQLSAPVDAVTMLTQRVQDLENRLGEHDAALEKRDRAPITTFLRRLKEILNPRKAREVRATGAPDAQSPPLQPPPYSLNASAEPGGSRESELT